LIKAALISAWTELLTNHENIIAVGTPLCSSDARCAGKAAIITSHHQREEVSNRPASNSEFGIHNVEIEPGCKAKLNPILAVT
jgi:hypothetical protein